MIDQGEIRRIAGALGVDPGVVDHDYALGCLLHYLASQDQVKESWIFKGGTSLAKCHFPEYRFSEDLDFTILGGITAASLKQIIVTTRKTMQGSIGIRTDFQNVRVDTIQDDYGQESFEGKLYYQGPWEYGGSTRSLQVHVNRDEKILFPTQTKSIHHSYSDRTELPKVSLQVYSLEEILVEKLRALAGQRKFAIARDVFDVHFLSKRSVDVQLVVKQFPLKCAVKRIAVKQTDIERMKQRRPEYETNWKNNLEYLIPNRMKVSFEDAWDTSIIMLEKAVKS